MTVFTHFEDLQDPRIDRTKHYDLHSLIFLTISAVVADCEHFTEIADFAEERLGWLQSHGHFLDGRTPSHDILGNLFRRMDPTAFQSCFMRWASEVCGSSNGTLVSMDGKTLRRSHDHGQGKKPIHVISAWSSANRVVLAQMKVDDKSNEITAIPELLALLDLEGAVVSIDAMGCQAKIAERIRDRGGDYLLGTKGNQGGLMQEVELCFVHHAPASVDEQWDKGHGRIESRTCAVLGLPDLPGRFPRWAGIQSLVRIISTREDLTTGARSEEIRFYVSSLKADASRFNDLVRTHWGVENQVHWVLDATFNEDGSRIRKDHGSQNMALIRRAALNICSTYAADKKPLSRRRKSAARSDAYLDAILGFKTR